MFLFIVLFLACFGFCFWVAMIWYGSVVYIFSIAKWCFAWVHSLFQGTFCYSYIFSVFPLDFTIDSYITLFCRQILFNGHSYFVLQLHVSVLVICAIFFCYVALWFVVFFGAAKFYKKSSEMETPHGSTHHIIKM